MLSRPCRVARVDAANATLRARRRRAVLARRGLHHGGAGQEQPQRLRRQRAAPGDRGDRGRSAGRSSTALDVVEARIEQDVVTRLPGRRSDRARRRQHGFGRVAPVPGLTLVNDQFIYVRGLGERYSSVQFNGAQVPSPDLTRNVIPLDIFPTEIIQRFRSRKAIRPK